MIQRLASAFLALTALAACSVGTTLAQDPAPAASRVAVQDVTPDPAPGIDRDLARARRAAIGVVHYELAFALESGAGLTRGKAEVRFGLSQVTGPVVFDFAGDDLADVQVNDRPLGAAEGLRLVNGHIVIPTAALRPGQNTFEATFSSRVASTGTPLTRYRDTASDQDFLYTLVVPADAHRLFPCFDQPDIKATYGLTLTTPSTWRAVANGEQLERTPDPDTGTTRWRFAETKPLSTYLFAFAAGPFAEVLDSRPSGVGIDPTRRMRMLVRDSKLEDLEAARLFEMHRDALRWLGEYFGVPYPFGKLDIVLLPGFPYGGMEHAGAIFYREASLVFDHAPTDSEQTRRSTLIYHEVSHQWFGNLVTMEWFDDLWLKEGFATFVGYTLLDVLEPGKNAWLRFHQRVKPRAYAIDGTRGTTPIYQSLQNLADAKSAYGAIVYNKAPAVLRELHARLGPNAFRAGVEDFLRRHSFGNARWQDLAAALDRASGRSNAAWSDRWILGEGMPRVRVDWSAEDGAITEFSIVQEGVQNRKDAWPLRVTVMLIRDGEATTHEVETDLPRRDVRALIGETAPDCVLLNPRDVAYGLFLLDPTSQDSVCDSAESIEDLLVRSAAMSALWATLREGELDPRRYAATALRLLEREADPETQSWLLGTLATTLGRYLPPDAAAPLRTRTARLLLDQLRSGIPNRALQTVRFLARSAGDDDAVQQLLRGLLDGSRSVSGLELGRRDRFLLAASLVASGDTEPLEREIESAGNADVAKEVYLARAATPDPAGKAAYFATYAELEDPPEQWMQDSLPFFHWRGQSEVTLPFLAAALDKVEWVKEHRKIFFMPAWIDAFINAHSSPAALDIAQRFLDERGDDLSVDIRRKILQSLDGLERAVRIRSRWP